MSAISTYLEYIRSKIYAKDVRTAIVNAISQCYTDIEKTENDVQNKVPFPTSPNSKYGTNGQSLVTLGNGKTKWQNVGEPSPEVISSAVSDWLDDHPEATTTVQDGSITSKKLKNTSIPFYNVADYGILPDLGDVYSELYDLLANYVYDTGGIVYFPKGTYTLSFTIFIPENTTFIGDGEDTEIYFDETDTNFGVGLSNAGSNVSVKNMKVSQETKGIFHSGAQPGCMAFGDIAKTQARAGKYSHTYTRADTYNLVVENVTFDGFYAMQTENSANNSVHNVIYRNLYCPDSCVSVMAGLGGIHNVTVENVVCDLIRVYRNTTEASVKNVNLKNIKCQNFVLSNTPDVDDCKIIVANLYQTSSERKNDLYPTNNGLLQGSIVFDGCVFNSLSTEINGINLYSGVKEFRNCLFNMQQRIFTNNVSLSSGTNYIIANDCIFNRVNSGESGGLLFGYGKNNKYSDTNISNWLWGDMSKRMNLTTGADVTSVTGSIPKSRIYISNGEVWFKAYITIKNTNNLGTYSESVSALPFWGDIIPVMIWEQSDRSATQKQTFAKVTDGKLQVIEPGLTNVSTYNRAMISTKLQLLEPFTILDLYNLYSVSW